jgi:glycolate oxidase iron-sulfur subunit
MQTHFTPQQLTDPDVAVTDRILRACVHCGFCTATCPTYLLTGDELDGPRGRIYLAKDMLEKDRPADATTVKHLDRCLTCLSCMTTCPSGVHYMHLLDHARRHIEQTYRRPLPDRLMRWVLATVLPYTGRFRFALTAAGWVRPFRRLFPRRLRNLLELAAEPGRPERLHSRAAPSALAAHRFKRVALLPGCVQPVMRPEINEATVRLLNRYGVDVVVAKGTGCCGALVHHLGREESSHAQAKADIDAWTAEIESRGLDAIIVTASGCGTMLKDYGFIFRNDPAYAAKAERVASLAKDVTEVLAELHLERRTPLPTMRVAYHSACSLQHGQKLNDLPAALLRQVGFNVVGVPESHLCCGSAGTYNILQPEMAGQLRSRKVANIESVHPDVIAAGNIGCLTQIAEGTTIPLVHTVELLDWATGGTPPISRKDRPAT